MYPQQITILGSTVSALAFAIAGSASKRLRRMTAPILLLLVVAIYESYMFFIWEKKVVAPIRLDLFVELIVSAASIVYGLFVLLTS